MPTVSCTGCGKRLNAKPEFIGKKLKCPACGTTFVAADSGSTVQKKGGGQATVATQATRTKAADKGRKNVAVSINYGMMALIGGGVLVVGLIAAFVIGPVGNNSKWGNLSGKANDNVESVIHKALILRQREREPKYDPDYKGPRIPPKPPGVDQIVFMPDLFGMSMPETVKFKGTSTEGSFTGTYAIETGQVEAEVEVEGSGMAANIEMTAAMTGGADPERSKKMRSGQTMNVSGKVLEDGKVDVTYEGKHVIE